MTSMDFDLETYSLSDGNPAASFAYACVLEHFGTMATFMTWLRWWELGRTELDLMLRAIAESIEDQYT